MVLWERGGEIPLRDPVRGKRGTTVQRDSENEIQKYYNEKNNNISPNKHLHYDKSWAK